ncbi:chromate efflux transporter [Staphylococcus massiliensis]|uniref:chromate efflux transporter n=1 Tax=Staphylococcus massiliensis TaxID=555791 RepID=UPI001EDDBCED|nr:chromate efflux transporter [Staphylococcus massiliensis]MCG3412972.1 chromate efflux transporter [Staphylococcus massiliensis]
MKRLIEIFVISFKLGLMSFGGPTAHLGYFYDEYVKRRKWLDEKSYTDLVALCQFLPGPASSQVGIGIGTARGGLMGGIVSFIGFTLPSVIVLMLFALIFSSSNQEFTWIQGLKLVAVAIVAQAIIGMGKKLNKTKKTKLIALFVLLMTLLINHVMIQIIALAIAGIIGFFFLRDEIDTSEKGDSKLFHLPKSLGIVSLSLFFILLFILPIMSSMTNSHWVKMFDSFYRSGALVFGGGHVVLPLLQQELVPSGMMNADTFITGYGVAQAVPGPLFTFASYLGTAISGIPGGLLATIAIFLPAFLLLFGILPFWDAVKNNHHVKAVLKGVSAGVIGILITAFFTPIWTSTIKTNMDFGFAALLFALLMYFKFPSWAIVLIGLVIGIAFY